MIIWRGVQIKGLPTNMQQQKYTQQYLNNAGTQTHLFVGFDGATTLLRGPDYHYQALKLQLLKPQNNDIQVETGGAHIYSPRLGHAATYMYNLGLQL